MQVENTLFALPPGLLPDTRYVGNREQDNRLRGSTNRERFNMLTGTGCSIIRGVSEASRT